MNLHEELGLEFQLPDISTFAYYISEKIYKLRLADGSSELDLINFKLPSFFKTPELSKEFLDQFNEYLNSDRNFNLTDYYLDGTVIKMTKYDPFTCMFKSSGRVVLENDLREFFEEPTASLHGRKGNIDHMTHYSNVGMIHLFVGNSCPTFWINNDETEIIVGTKYNDDDVDMDGYKKWGYVTTDLWWYSLVDLEVFKLRSKLSNEEIESNYTVLDLPAGEWKLEHYYGVTKSEHDDFPYGKLIKIK